MRIETGSVEIDGARSTSLSWARFDSKKTGRTCGLKLLRQVILNNHVSHTVPAPWTHRDLVQQIAEQSQQRIPIESLPPVLADKVHQRGCAIVGFPGRYVDQVARNYEDMYWWVSQNGLNMAVRSERESATFDIFAARLMEDARQRGKTKWIAPGEYTQMAVALDEAGFSLPDHLERKCRKQLKDWNQKHSNRAIRTFSEAFASKIRWLRRGIKKRLYRATEKSN